MCLWSTVQTKPLQWSSQPVRTMMNLTLMTALLSAFSWISISVADFHTVESQPGEEVTLLCSNFTRFPTHIYWFKLSNSSNNSCISYMLTSDGNTSFCDGFQNGKFNMSSNTTTLFLRIKEVELSDSGLYFCGFYTNSAIVSATYLKVQEMVDGIENLMSVVLGAVIIVLVIVVISLAVQIRKHHTVHKEGLNPQHSENLTSNDLTYAALSFHPKAKTSRRPPAEQQLESNVVYAATRKTQETTRTAAQGGIVASSRSTHDATVLLEQ
ncbi:uncharacterized protein LOC119027451 [Acanthopagrus latus]|uniref:uncharacterized protein LOC119027451 n=1 Tax=Acanthopagrus latus TaxID=8177 RepID=UPI00187C2FA4|nr:uncharacterized protein LOC119027451 [Acanthopagrus latus]